MPVNKPKPKGKQTKWEKRRVARRVVRIAQGKKPIVEPLAIAPAAERKEALKKGRMVFYDGKKRIALPLMRRFEKISLALQGIYRMADGKIVTLRFTKGDLLLTSSIRVMSLRKLGRFYFEKELDPAWFVVLDELGHMNLVKGLRGQGLGLKSVSKAERHVRTVRIGRHLFETDRKYGRLFSKLGYRIVEDRGKKLRMEKVGKPQPKDDLKKFHRIEALDSKTGKARIFTFPVQSKE